MIINYVSNIPYAEQSGGGSGVNSATINELNQHFKVNILPSINPPIDTISKLQSVICRKLGLKGGYHFFSNNRLTQINKEFAYNVKGKVCEAYFFHGFTPWIKTQPDKPYFCFNDACFATYVDIYNNKNEFSGKDLDRIYSQETKWLKRAKKVFFRSQWALDETKKWYQIDGHNFENVGVGGFIEMPKADLFSGGHNFLFVSREFIPKGGLVVAEAISKVRIKYPDAEVWVVGQKPPDYILKQEGINYKGFFDKSAYSQKQDLIEIFSHAFALVHPTIKDTNTLVINELAYYGCPAIASHRFAIPEYLLDNATGFLLNDPQDANELAEKMCLLIENKDMHKNMRNAARENAIRNNTWENVGKKIATTIKSSF